MPLDQAKLETILQAANPAAVAKFFRGAGEADRELLAPAVKAWSQRLERNWRAQFDRKAQDQVKSEGEMGDWYALMPAAYLAALACLTLAQIKSLHIANRPNPAMIAEVLRDRRPDWLDEYAILMCGQNVRRWSVLDWKLVRQLVRDKLCKPPQLDSYVLGAIEGIKPPFDLAEHLRRKDAGLPPLPVTSLVELLLAERDWIDSAFWRLFEIEGTGEVSLANGEKYSKGESWTTAIIELSKRGILSRERLLDASLAALNRDFIQFRAGWFSHFHEAMTPTIAEREQRLPAYFQLLGSAIPPTVTFALKAVQVLDKEKPIAGVQLARHLESVLSARSKTAVTGALQLLDRAARREPGFSESAARMVALALLHESPEVQEKALVFLEKHGGAEDSELRDKLAEVGEHVTPSLRKQLAALRGISAKLEASPDKPANPPKAEPQRQQPCLDPANAITPIATLDELILAASAMIESPDNPMEIERVLDGLSRLGTEHPADFERHVGPLRKRALKKRDDKQGSYPRHSKLDRALAMLLLTWMDGQDGFTEDAISLAGGQNHFAFLFRRLKALGNSLSQEQSLPLLSAPTHGGGWIDPVVLVARWQEWQQAGVEPNLHEQVLALLRLAPENRKTALRVARSITGESGEALRLAVGADVKTGKNIALWLAAWRCRQPHGDLPEFEKAHPKLGPDAGTVASYKWMASGKRSQHGDLSWTTFEIQFSASPECSATVGDALLPILMHGKWNSAVENAKPLLRWAATLWPCQREVFFARGIKPLALSLNYADAMDRDISAFLEPLADPHTGMKPVATLALALGLAAEDAALRGHAQEGLIAAIGQARLNVSALASVMSELLATGINKFARWGKTLREVARVSPLHAARITDLLQQSLRGDPTKGPRDIHALLELLVELQAETGSTLNDPQARQYVQGIKTGGRTAKLVKKLLG